MCLVPFAVASTRTRMRPARRSTTGHGSGRNARRWATSAPEATASRLNLGARSEMNAYMCDDDSREQMTTVFFLLIYIFCGMCARSHLPVYSRAFLATSTTRRFAKWSIKFQFFQIHPSSKPTMEAGTPLSQTSFSPTGTSTDGTGSRSCTRRTTNKY